jgi:nitroreductase
MDLDKAIMGRRSIRKFQSREVPRELIEQTLQAAIYAPSAKNGQQWRFTVLTGEAKQKFTTFFRETLERICEEAGKQATGSAFHSCKRMEDAPVNIVVWNTSENNWETEIHSVAAAIQNLLLKAYSLGLGTLWIGDIFHAYTETIEYFNKPWKLIAVIVVGWPDENPPPRSRKLLEEVTEFIVS